MEDARGCSTRLAVIAAIATGAACGAAVSGAIVYSRHRRQAKLQNQLKLLDDKPQKRFKRVLADNSDSPFQHYLSPVTGLQDGHPYEDVIRELAESLRLSFEQYYSDNLNSIMFPPGMGGPCIWVQTRSQLEALVQVLKEEKEIGVDMEHHSVRSFRGYTALVQISTHTTDYLVDAIALHDDMHLLHPVFANPAICKVFHGADNDSLWLQRDFHIYIVNLFDTARACDVLGKPQRSLAYLLHTYCGILTDKIYQKADWRVRPLPVKMAQYARTDAHYLLYIAHRLRTESIQLSGHERGGNLNGKEILSEIVRRSNLCCLQLYEKEGVGVTSSTVATSLLGRFYSNSSSPTLAEEDGLLRKLVQRLCEWRDAVARAEDESLRFVLSDAALLALATERRLSHESVLSTIKAADTLLEESEALVVPGLPPLPSPSPIVRQHITSLYNVLCEFGEDLNYAVWPWSASTKTVPGDSLYQRVCSLLREPLLFLWGLRSSSDGNLMSAKDGVPTGTRRPETWVRRTIPKKWRLGDVEQARLQFVKKFSCKAPVYHNCRIYAGDGRLLCFCDRKKLEWYVKRGLAEDLKEEPPAIRLLFEPKGRPEDENNDYYIQSKSNRCVGCGESSHYLRYRIIPSCYRQHFPEHLKSHRSHDIVLLCVDCHEVAHRAAEKHKREIAVQFGVPLFAQRVVDSGNEAAVASEVSFVAEGESGGVSPLQLRTAAMALARYGSTMPVERRKQLEEVVRAYYGGREIGPEDLNTALLVGMGPREHRRLLRKRNLRQRSNNPSRNEHLSTTNAESQTLIGFPHPSGDEVLKMAADVNTSISQKVEDHTLLSHLKSGQEERGAGSDMEQHVDTIGSDDDDGKGTRSLEPAGKHSRRSMHKESLLGHGPHGRQVVDMLIAQDGDEGIRQFCQLWRAVFVEALQPAFLPPGWDVSHSGHREFGEFSVYNPDNRHGHK